MKNKLAQILLFEDLKPFKLIENDSYRFIVIGTLLIDKIENQEIKIFIYFDFIFETIRFKFISNEKEYNKHLNINELKNYLKNIWKTSEFDRIKLLMFINDIILQICRNYHKTTGEIVLSNLKDKFELNKVI